MRAFLALATIVSYLALYTPAKRVSRWSTELGAVAKAFPDAIIGSYPFQDDKLGPNTNIVVRSRDAARLAEVRAAVEAMLAKVKAQLAS